MARTQRSNVAEKPTWEFLYWDDKGEPYGDPLLARYYRAPSLIQAASRMVRWLRGQLDRGHVWNVDQEARACHLDQTKVSHEEYYPDLLDLDHPIRDYV